MPKLLFDLDGTLTDSVYQHVAAWHATFQQHEWNFPVYQLHRKIGMSGGVLVDALSRESNREFTQAQRDDMERVHEAEFTKRLSSVRALPGARELLEELRRSSVEFVIVTSSRKAQADALLAKIQLPFDVPLVTKEDTGKHKPDPAGFITGARKIGAEPTETIVVGDSVWDMLAAVRAHYLGVGFLCGGYGEDELAAAGAFRIYAGPGEMLRRLNELGIERE